MLRVRSITPIDVPADELARRQQRYDRLSPPGIAVTLDNIGDGAPRSLDTAADIRASDERVTRLARATDPRRFDVVVPDCVLDPGVEADAPVPVAGILRLAAGHCAAFRLPFGSVTRNPAIGEELERRLRQYGLDRRYTGNDVLALDFDSIADDARWRGAVAGARDRLAERGAVAVLNGCSAVDLGDDASVGPVVLDPTRLALALLAAGAQAGLDLGARMRA
jgi:Asp/Glu/hydantoin racemase